ncbi:PAS-domain containing protein, partial [Oceanicella sp. SM1341]|uniref:PAS-domain containing protein n=1 Tax=Oceanicella sp. SM1341 TaxID=1548889 RepID=UPI000E4D61E2
MGIPAAIFLPGAVLTGWIEALPAEVTAFLAALLGAALGAALLLGQQRYGAGQVRRAISAADGCIFLFRGMSLHATTAAGRRLIDSLPESREGQRIRLVSWLSRQSAELSADLAALFAHHRPFTRDITTRDGQDLEVTGETRGALVSLVLRDISDARRAQRAAEERAARLEEECAYLRVMVSEAPALIWRRRGGKVLWANAAYCQEMVSRRGGQPSEIAWLFPDPNQPPEGASADFGPLQRRMPLRDPGGEPKWYDVTELAGPADDVIGFALSADGIMRAEAALKRFVETLTETFAHLPIGLAIFDKNRRLGLFNPAISEILKLDPTWLAARPGLQDFLERLRENRQMPDQQDFLAWRRKLTVLERDAEAASYEEDWVLPSGQTLRVIGRPHPQGAIAFLFEDISSAVILERRYRSEIETFRAVLHKLPEATLLFGPDGNLAFANHAFRSIWPSLGPAEPGTHVSRLIGLWSALCRGADPEAPATGTAGEKVWRDLKDFITRHDSRSAWSARLRPLDGRVLVLRVAPMPDGSTLVSFGDETDRERLQASLRARMSSLEQEADLARAGQAESRNRAEEPLRQLEEMVDLASRRGDSALRAGIADAVATLRIFLAPPETGETGEVDLPGLLRSLQRPAREAAAARRIEISIVMPEEPTAPLPLPRRGLRRLCFHLVADAIAASVSQGEVTIETGLSARWLTLIVVTRRPARAAPLGEAGPLVRRIAGEQGARIEAGPDGAGGRRLICRVPLHSGDDGEEGEALPAAGMPRAPRRGKAAAVHRGESAEIAALPVPLPDDPPGSGTGEDPS